MAKTRKAILMTMVFILFLPVFVLAAGTVDLPETGQTTIYAPGDDGDIQAGVPWPEPRFTDNTDGTVTDNLTGLVWLKNANCFVTRTWADALTDASTLMNSMCGLSDGSAVGDWRLPNVNELESLINAEVLDTAAWLNQVTQGFSDVQSEYYWSSTTSTSVPNPVYAWIVDMGNGYMVDVIKDTNYHYVWPVRAGQANSADPTYPANIPKTGQKTSYEPGDDGALQMGVAWPIIRFEVNGDCVTDNLTGLMWARDANLLGGMPWPSALISASGLSLCGYNDWRLPNRKELRSLIDYSMNSPALPLDHPFTSVGSVTLMSDWSSTTRADFTSLAWIANMWNGYIHTNFKDAPYYVWPVRAGLCKRPPSGMVGWWPGDNNANDISGYGNDGTLKGSADYVAGKVDNAFSVNGSADFVEVPYNSSFNLNSFSIDAWISTTSSGTATIIDNRTGTTKYPVGYCLFLYNGRLGFQLGDGLQFSGNYWNSSSSIINDGNWHHVAVTINRGSNTGGILYVDGTEYLVFDPTNHPNNIFNTADLRIGQRYLSAAEPFNGAIDEVEIFNRALFDWEIKAIFDADSAGKCKTICPPILDQQTDTDNDGIADAIDRNKTNNTDESSLVSNDFNDIPLGGTTSGTITDRNGWTVTIGDAINPDGVQVSISGGGTNAYIGSCYADGPERVALDGAGETANITCVNTSGTNTGSMVTAVVANFPPGNPRIEVRKPPTGGPLKANVPLEACQTATVGSPITASPDNTQPILVEILDENENVRGSGTLDPGQTIDIELGPDGEVVIRNLAATPLAFTIDGVTITLSPGQSFTTVVEVCDGIDNDGDNLIDEYYPVVNTSCGSDVHVTPDGVTLTFSDVTLNGNTTVTTSGTGQPPPSGFKLGATPTYYEITTTATFTGPVEVCINYDENQFTTERNLNLFHWEGGSWKNITTSIDTVANIICGNTTSFSPFIVAEELSTAVTLQNISAHLDGNQVILNWSTSFEIDNEGFIILRAESPGGPFTPITQGMIPAAGGSGKATYTFTDNNVEQRKTYYYQLQDIDSRGRITSHRALPVTVAFARAGEPSQGSTNHEDITAINQQKTDVAVDKGSVESKLYESSEPAAWISVVESNNQIISAGLETVPAEDEMAENRIPAGAPSPYDEKFQQGIESQRQTSPETLFDVRGHEVETQHPVSGSSSFSVSIEDDKGNIIVVRRLEDTANTSTPGSDIEISEESGRMVLTWQGQGKAKGFILHRAEKGKDNYTPITGLIPYFGRNDKDIFLYRFTDNSAKPGGKYDYRLERVKSIHKPDLTIGKLSE